MNCCSHLFRKKSSSSVTRLTGVDLDISEIQNVNIYTYKELRIATEGFSPTNKIGQGGFGSVYKGKLRNGSMVAIKVLSAESRQGIREFLTEIKVIASIEHENLVKLYGCCVEDNHRILVYGFLENNSLAQILGAGHCSIQFSWDVRRNICIGVARGLAFLHEEVRPHIIHRDIKASNVLLDKNLQPKISDFGLAKLIAPNLTHISTRVAGTAGYLAPEYAIRNQVTRKSDIYSFGVLLLEIVSGKPNTNRRLPVTERFLLTRAWDLYEKGKLDRLVDDFLLGEDFNVEEAVRFCKIGLLCTQDSPQLRPSMSTLLDMLIGEKDVNEENMTKPGMIFEFVEANDEVKQKGKAEVDSESLLAGSGKHDDSSASGIVSSFATMSFTAICDRSN